MIKNKWDDLKNSDANKQIMFIKDSYRYEKTRFKNFYLPGLLIVLLIIIDIANGLEDQSIIKIGLLISILIIGLIVSYTEKKSFEKKWGEV